jgi:hypothetical protein
MTKISPAKNKQAISLALPPAGGKYRPRRNHALSRSIYSPPYFHRSPGLAPRKWQLGHAVGVYLFG